MLEEVKDVLWGGITYDEVVSGGPLCVVTSSIAQRVCESIFACSLAIFVLNKIRHRLYLEIVSGGCKSIGVISSDNRIVHGSASDSIFSQASIARILLLIFTLVFGIEVGFKLATRSLIWLMYPCHIATMALLLSLVLPQNSIAAPTIFRVATYWLNGATVALIYHVTATRQLNGEVYAYFAQHLLLLLVPFCLIATSYFRPDPPFEFTWPACAAAVMTLYNFGILVPLSIATDLNFGYMLCAAPGDPMPPAFYRLCHLVLQTIIGVLTGKVLILLSQTRLYKID